MDTRVRGSESFASVRGDAAQLAIIGQGIRDLGPGLVVVVVLLLYLGVV